MEFGNTQHFSPEKKGEIENISHENRRMPVHELRSPSRLYFLRLRKLPGFNISHVLFRVVWWTIIKKVCPETSTSTFWKVLNQRVPITK